MKNLLILLGLGIFSGLPFLLVLSTLSFWLAESGVNNQTIGLFVGVSIPYSLKFFWAPFIDRTHVPFLSNYLGQKRAWGITAQIGVVLFLLALSFSNPNTHVMYSAIMAMGVSMCAATQDIIMDTYRIQTLSKSMSGYGASMESIGFRLGMLLSGAFALYLAHWYGWQFSYQIMALIMSFGVVFFLLMDEPQIKNPHTSIGEAFRVWETFPHMKEIKIIFTFIILFKTMDTVLSTMSAPFFHAMGASKIEYANVSKIYGVLMTVLGALVGGKMIHSLGFLRSLKIGAIGQFLSCFAYAYQAGRGHDTMGFMVIIGLECFSAGMNSTIFMAYLSSLCRPEYAATHFTFLQCMGSMSRVLISMGGGWLSDRLIWPLFFLCIGTLIFPLLYLQIPQLPRVKKSI
jgi:PAT family beta-lactamase induction signal transducer AmpG